MKNIETPDKKHLESIINDLRECRYGIPDFQRDFEWSPWDVVELLKSIFEDYYIGTLLLWKASRENIEYLSCKPIYGSKDDGKFEHIVLDGQQRLSALYYAFFAPDKKFPFRKSKYYYVIYLDKLLENNYDEAFEYIISSRKNDELINNEELQFEQKIFPLKILGSRSHYWSRWFGNYEKYWLKKDNAQKVKIDRDKLEKIFESILNEYYISYIELDREIEVEKVCDIFQRINSTGLALNIFDLMNALLRPKEIKLKELWKKEELNFQTKLPDVDKGKIYTLQTMSILKQAYCAPKYLYYLIPSSIKWVKEGSGSLKKIVLIDSKETFLHLWQTSIKEMMGSLKIITNHSDLGVIKEKFFPYPTMLPIFTAINIEKTKEIYKDKKAVEDKIRYWYWSSIFTKNYSSSVESQMAKDFTEMKKWFLDDNAIPTVVSEARSSFANLDFESEENQNSAIYKAIFCILIREGALDFSSYESPVYSELDDHHIMPKSWGNKNKVEFINSILNRTPLSNDTNRKIIHEQSPNIYIRTMLKRAKKESDVYKLLETHLISYKAVQILLRDGFAEQDYKEFIRVRKEAIMDKIKDLVGGQTEFEKKLEESPNEALNIFETNLRNFIDKVLVEKNVGDYWKKGIPGDVKTTIEQRIEREIRKNPYIGEVGLSRQKLNYIDVTEYFLVLRHNWDVFEKYFVNKENCNYHFKNICDFRNQEKHVRENNSVVKKLGEASLEWVNNITSNSLDNSCDKKAVTIETEGAEKEFWVGLLEKSNKKLNLYLGAESKDDCVIRAYIKHSQYHYFYYIKKSYGGCGLYFCASKESNKKRYDAIFSHKKEIEQEFGLALEWLRNDNQKGSEISIYYRHGGLKNKEKWNELQDKMVDSMIKIERIFSRYIKELD